MPDVIYLDNNATTRVADEVLAAMTPLYISAYGNAHAIHQLGRRAHDAVESARSEVAALIGCESDAVIFTSCGTESNALVIRGLVDAQPSRRKVVTTAVEHPSVLTLLRGLAEAGEIELAVIPVGLDGQIDIQRLEDTVDDQTLLVTVMLAQNETGVIHPVRQIADIAHSRGALVHVDAVQAAGKIALSRNDLGADFVTISGHKFHAPKGVGALSRPRGFPLRPLWYGGGQELGLRSGTEPVPAIAGLGLAARMALEHLGAASEIERMRNDFESAVQAKVDEVSINGATQPRLPNTANISFHDVAADDLVRALDAAGICVSAGAACHSGRVEPSPTMRAMNKPLRAAMGAVRFSLSRYTTEEELNEAVNIVAATVPQLRQLSTVNR